MKKVAWTLFLLLLVSAAYAGDGISPKKPGAEPVSDGYVAAGVTPKDWNGPQEAVYDPALGAPKCEVAGSECDTVGLVDGRDGLGPEPNQPNTLDGCPDGTSGTYHSDESNDRIVVSTLDGSDFTEGATVRIDATVWAWSTGSSDALDLYYAAEATSPDWVYVATLVPPAGGPQTLSATYTLPSGCLQAVRASFRYDGSVGPCTSGSYDDRDDLVFAVTCGGCTCVSDADCDDGLFCNGIEICDGCNCHAGTAVDCDDGVSCTDDLCNDGSQSCDHVPNDAYCDNGLFCDGVEICDPVLDCQAGTAVDCDDGVECTEDYCNEITDVCESDETACPRCDDCHTVQDSLFECLHYAGDPNGTACSKTACIENTLDSASCTLYPARTGPPDCDTDTDTGPEIVQVVRQSPCPGGTVNWTVWRTLYYGCGTTCQSTPWQKSCETGSCTGKVIMGPSNRGQKKKCGC